MSAYTLKITTKGQSSAVKLPLGKTQTILADENTQYQILDADGKLLSQPRVEENSGDLWVFLDEDNVPELILQNYGEQYPIRDVQQLSDSYSTFLTGNSQAAASLPPATAKTVSAGLIGAGIAAVSTSLAVLAADKDDSPEVDRSITQPKVLLNPIQNINQNTAKNKVTLSGTVQDVDSDAAVESVEVRIGDQTHQAQVDKQSWTLTLDAQDLVQQQGENRLTVRAQVADVSGNRAVSEDTAGVYQVDTVAPAATLNLEPVNYNKIIHAGNKTVTLTGSVGNLAEGEAVEGATVQIQIGKTTHQAALQANGQFSLTLPAAAFSPSDSVSAHIVVKDAAGNSQNVSAQQEYLYDVTAPKVTVTINEINGGKTINAAVKNKGLTVSGSLQYDNDVDVGSVRVSINTGKGNHAATVKGKKWTLTLTPSDLPNDGSYNLIAHATVNDRAGNGSSHSSSRAYQLDTQVEQPQITFEAITADNIISKTEAAAEKLTVTGKVTHAREGDEVVLTVGTQEYKGTVQQGGFAVAVATAALVSGRSIRATVKTADEAGNRSEGTAEHQYDVRLDTQTATLRLDSVTADNILNAEESAAATVRISGSSTHLPDGSTVHIRIGQHSFEAQVKANSFSADIPTEVLKAHQQIQLSAEAQDSLGNTLSASHEHTYQVDTIAPAPTITLYPLMEHNRINLSHQDKNVMIKGLVSNLAEGDRAENGKVNIHIGTQSFQVNLQKDGHFVLIQPAATFAGSDKVSADVRVLDMAGNSKSVSDGLNYVYDMTPPQVTVTVDNINSGKIINAAVKNQGLTVSGSLQYDDDVDVGSVRVNINTGKGSHAATVKGKTWTLTLQPTDLPADGSHNLTAEVTANDRAGNSGSHSSSRAYQLDTQVEQPQITFEAITADNIISKTEAAAEKLTVTGKVTHAREGDEVVLTVGTQEYKGTVQQGGFAVAVATAALVGGRSIRATVKTADEAGNRSEGTAEHQYDVRLDTQTATLRLDSVTADNILNAEESAAATVRISGSSTHLPDGSTVHIRIGQHSFEAQVKANSFSADIPTKVLKAHQQIQLSAEAQDSLGNTLSASHEHTYQVDTVAPAATLTLDPVNPSKINASSQSVILTGSVSNLAEGEAVEGAAVQIQIGQTTHQAALQANGQFSLTLPAAAFSPSDSVSAHIVVKDAAGNSQNVSAQQAYLYDVTAPKVTVTINEINNGQIINAAVKNQGLTVSGSLQYDDDVDVGSVRVNINTGKGNHAATVKGKTWTLTLTPSDLPNDGSYNLIAHATVNDRAGNGSSHSSSRAYQLDTQINAQLAIDQVTGDDVVNSVDKNQAAVRISGRASGEFSENDRVEVQIGTHRETVQLDGQGQFSVTVSGSVLAAANKVSAVLQASDAAGNTVSVSAERPYEVKLSGDVRIVLNKVTTDNVLQIAEQSGQIELSGKLEGKDAAAGQTVILTVNNQSFEAVVGNDKQFKVSVPAEALVKDADHKIQATLKAVNDSAGNPLTASASHSYKVEQASATDAVIKITAVDNDFVIGYNQVHPYSAADTVLSGRINIDPDSIWGKWNKANARYLEEVSFNIGGKEYVAAISKTDQSFRLSLSQDQWQKLAGQALSYEVKHETFWLNNPVPTVVNTKEGNLIWKDNKTGLQITEDYLVRFPKDIPLEIDPKQIILTGSMVKDYGNGQYAVQKVANPAEKVTVSGTVSGADVKAGDTVTVYIGSKTHQAQVTAEKTFSVQVSATELANSQTHEVRAELNVRNAQNEAVTVSDRATYTVAPKMSGHFVSEHGKVDVSTMPYFMQTMPYDQYPADHGHQSEGGKHTLGTGANLKVHFVTAAEFANDNKTEKVEYSKQLQDAVREVFRKIGQSVNVTFEEVASQQDADINFYMENFALFTGERAKFNDAAGIARYGGFVSLNSNLYVKEADGWEKYDGFHTTMHEIFHSMGLKHPHDGNILLNKVEDSTALTSMSYEHDKDFVDIHDMRIFDMAYLHYRYGVAKGARTGNDTYSFKPFNTKTADGDVYIWDGGGVDAFDASAEKQGVYVNLTPGSWIYSGKRTERFVLSDMVETTFNAYKHFGLDTSASVRNNWDEKVYDPSFVEGQAFIGYGTQIENLIGSAHNDVLIGNNADNVIHGGAGADTLEGGLGNDWLDGGAGADILRGGTGNDFYLIDSAQDRIEESDNNGRDTVYSTIDYKLGDFVEDLHLLGDALKAEGNALNNTLVGNSRDNVLNGGQGSDTLTGGAGADHFVFSSLLEGQPDIITDFKAGEDKIVLKKSVFTALTEDNLTEKLSLEKETGKLFYDAQGNGQKVHFATLSGNHGLDELDQNHFILA